MFSKYSVQIFISVLYFLFFLLYHLCQKHCTDGVIKSVVSQMQFSHNCFKMNARIEFGFQVLKCHLLGKRDNNQPFVEVKSDALPKCRSSEVSFVYLTKKLGMQIN